MRTQRANRERWWAHAARNRAFIVDAVAECRGHDLAVVLGAGQVFDLPIRELARAFRRVLLVDIDRTALRAAALLPANDVLGAQIEAVAMDLTGINQRLVHRVDALVAGAASAADAEDAVTRHVASYQLVGGPALVPGAGRADLLVSSCLLTQLAWSQQRYAQRAFWRRFGMAPSSAVWAAAWRFFERGVQQDHVDALTSLADVAVLTSDTAMHTTAVDAAGVARRVGAPQLPLHARSLSERIRPPAIVAARASWTWDLRAPDERRGAPGLSCDVEALRLRRG